MIKNLKPLDKLLGFKDRYIIKKGESICLAQTMVTA